MIKRTSRCALQLTPQGTHLFNASVPDREKVRYVSFSTVAPTPKRFRSDIFYRLAHGIAARHDQRYPLAGLEGRLKRRVSKKLGVAIDPKTNDGVVPTLSQIHGRIGGIVLGDHMDVVGLFTRTEQTDRGWQPPWLKSGAGFTERRFQKLWQSIAAELARPPHAVDPPTEVI